MKFTIAATLFAGLAAAAPVSLPGLQGLSSLLSGLIPGQCLSQQQAEQTVQAFVTILEHNDVNQSRQIANALLGDNFYENSESINALAGNPLKSITFQGKQGYINGLLSQPGPQDIQTNYVYVSNCNHITWKWIFGQVGSGQYPVSGINIFTINQQGQIANQDVEFNSVAWGVDIGYSTNAPIRN